MLVHIKKLFAGEVVGKFAYPAFNTQDLETTIGIIQAAEALNTPVIIATSEGTIKYAGLETIYEIMATLAQAAHVPIALHIDHGKDIEQLKKGIELGYSSVMIDHSSLPYEQNVADTQAIIDFAHARGAWVQGEIGRMRGTEDWVSVKDEETLLTEPAEALKYYQATGVDTLACSVGTVHGLIKMRGDVVAHVDLPRIKAIFELVKIPLVLHGASGVDEKTISQAILNGIAIINIDTELRLAFSEAVRKFLPANPEEADPRQIMKPVIEAVKQTAMEKLRQFKTQNLVN
jgi:ketose-bisphosphate aldolase